MSLAALVVAAVAASATPVASAEAPHTSARFAPGTIPGTVRYQVLVEGVAREDLRGTLGELHNLVVVAGPALAQEVAWRAGQTSAVTVLTWVLRAPGPGPIGVGPTRVEIDGHEFVAREVAGTAFLGGHTSAEPPPPSLRLELSRRRLFVGEALVAEFFLDAAGGDGAWEVRPRFPSAWSEPLPTTRSATEGGGAPGRALGGWLLIPARAGTLEIPSARASRTLAATDRDEPLRPDGVVASAPATVEVEPLPAPPPGFFGAVGELTVTRRISPARVRVGELATLEVEVRGQGNFPIMEVPPFAPPPEVRAFSPEVSGSWEVTRAGLTGSRAWRVPLAAERPGQVVLPAAELVTFRPDRGFVRAAVPALELLVEAAAPAGATGTAAPGAAGKHWPSLGWLLAGAVAGASGAAALVALRRRRRLTRLSAPPSPGGEPARLRTLLDRACRERYAAVPGDGEGQLAAGGCPPREATELVALHHELRRAEVAPGLGDREGGVLALAERVQAALSRLHGTDTL